MFKRIKNSQAPKILKVIAYILLVVTMVYLIGIFLYKFLEYLRIFLHWASDKRNWWTFIACVIFLIIGSLLIAQFSLDLNPFGRFLNWILEKWNDFKELLVSILGGA